MKKNKNELRRILYFREFVKFESMINASKSRVVQEHLMSRYSVKQVNKNFYGFISVSELKV